MLLMSVCATCQAVTASEIRTLVVYYTYSGVTETLAQNIANECGGTLLQVVDHGNYPRPESQQTYNYANNERSQIDAGNWPEILTSVEQTLSQTGRPGRDQHDQPQCAGPLS